jgi:hypothetical protein
VTGVTSVAPETMGQRDCSKSSTGESPVSAKWEGTQHGNAGRKFPTIVA